MPRGRVPVLMEQHSQRPIGLFGGTFDPIHHGHLRPALELLEILELEQVRLIPCADPPHRGAPMAPGPFRLEMARAAVHDQPGLEVDDREMRRPGPSYTLDTLLAFREELGPKRPLCLILGSDAFLGLPRWSRWEALLEQAHIVVAHRPGWQLTPDGDLSRVLEACRSDDRADLHRLPAGRILTQQVTQLEISSSVIREILDRGGSVRYLTPDPVVRMIESSPYYSRRPARSYARVTREGGV
ncbi:nicotinate-nucleotide adenylyltransferase [Natronospira bacteriovora]|uniref:Probable nicotinate-nucleotide adenylyltransferase n=1 Tax=Natronospira bacteriovora TaxID=3069753 RepID=A0ABU0W7G2_9GAMM|nr:nicotinate-nucleotide adenylyltransferase [Natronospira sp. AB-CW4]MDQ2069963.1 nicotinate-nucleotide adenylyltransferase [Natronospira sp. AB-CW4]